VCVLREESARARDFKREKESISPYHPNLSIPANVRAAPRSSNLP
jgi:hypothetical protein